MICKLYFVCIFAMFSMISSENFCTKFRGNDHKIGFTFRRDFEIPKEKAGDIEMQIIIDGECWPIRFLHKKGGAPQSLGFVNTESQKCSFFGKEYTLALCLQIDRNKRCEPFLFNTDTKRGVIGHIPNDDHKSYKPLTDYKLNTSLTIKGLSETSYLLVYQSERDQTRSKLVFVRLEGRKLEGKVYDWKLSGNTFEFIDDKTSLNNDYPLLDGKHSIGNEEVLAIISQYSEQEEVLRRFGYGFIFLLKDGSKINWCWTSANKYECKPQLLINCTHTEPVTEPKPPEEEEEEGSGWVIPAIIIIAVVVVIIVIVIVVMIFKSRKEEENEEQANSQISAVNDAAVLSKRSQDVTGSKVSAAGSNVKKSRVPSTGASATGQPSKASRSPSGSQSPKN